MAKVGFNGRLFCIQRFSSELHFEFAVQEGLSMYYFDCLFENTWKHVAILSTTNTPS